MEKRIVHSTRILQLGANITDPQLKIGKNHLDEEDLKKIQDQWFFKALVAEGSIVVEEPRPEPEMIEIVITDKSVEINAPTTAEVGQDGVKNLSADKFTPPAEKTKRPNVTRFKR